MLSIVVVYNDERALNEILLKSLSNQTAKFELIPIDNTKGQFESAAEALNYGAKRANGKYIMFVHQDVDLDSNMWLENAEQILETISDMGVAGVAGMSQKGKTNKERGRGYINDSGEIWQWGNAVQNPEKVQTLDESLLIIPKSVFTKLQFDEKTFDGWHCYGVDYCLSVNKMELRPYVLPAFIYHRSRRLNIQNLHAYQSRLYNKHKRHYKNIYTTTGEISSAKLTLSLLFGVISPLYARVFPSWIENFKNELVGCDTVLDLGCGYNSPLVHCNVPFSVGVELFDSYLDESKKKAIHNRYIKADIRTLELKPKCFDAVIGLEVLEHLTKDEGHALIRKMETWARKKVIITTPNEYLWQDAHHDNLLQEHKCGWSADELQELGFKVFGMGGWKKLRGYKGSVKYTPAFVWERISDLSQKITYHCPRLAFQLFATKEIGGRK
jgi:2-polyprenyl-3-methyl-5-hydroxy-6-metoxy-1,4-benzoquinol methylase